MSSIKVQIRNWDFLPVLMSEKLFSTLTGIPIKKVTDLCRRGKLPGAQKIGKFWFIEKTELMQHFIKGNADV